MEQKAKECKSNCNLQNCISTISSTDSDGSSDTSTFLVRFNNNVYIESNLNSVTTYEQIDSGFFKVHLSTENDTSGLQYEIKVYKNIKDKLIKTNICPYFVRELDSSIGCDFNDVANNFVQEFNNPNLKIIFYIQFILREHLSRLLPPEDIKKYKPLTSIDPRNTEMFKEYTIIQIESNIAYENQQIMKEKQVLNSTEILTSEDVKEITDEIAIYEKRANDLYEFLKMLKFNALFDGRYKFNFLLTQGFTKNSINFLDCVIGTMFGTFDLIALKSIVFQIVVGLYYLESIQITHNDIKNLRNIQIEILENEATYEYNINNTTYKITSKYKPLIYDFDLAYDENVGTNNRLTNEDIDVNAHNRLFPNKDATQLFTSIQNIVSGQSNIDVAKQDLFDYINGLFKQYPQEHLPIITNLSEQSRRYSKIYRHKFSTERIQDINGKDLTPSQVQSPSTIQILDYCYSHINKTNNQVQALKNIEKFKNDPVFRATQIAYEIEQKNIAYKKTKEREDLKNQRKRELKQDKKQEIKKEIENERLRKEQEYILKQIQQEQEDKGAAAEMDYYDDY
jgi:hypothetical protein